jgi:hypothetical protein
MSYLQIIATGIKYPIYDNNLRVIPISAYVTRRTSLPKLPLIEPLLRLYISDSLPTEIIDKEAKEITNLIGNKHNGWGFLTKYNYRLLTDRYQIDKINMFLPLLKEENTLTKYMDYLQSTTKDINKLWEYIEKGKAWGLQEKELLPLTLTYLNN